jgi:two-component system, OmpR family, heavy metal sensor histidine kinase CusS
VTGSVVRRLAAAGIVAMLGAQLVVGVVTGTVLHLRDAAALDRALLAAAQARARPDGDGTWTALAPPPPFETWIVAEGDGSVPPRIRARAAAGIGPLIKDRGDDRLVLVPVRGGREPADVVVVAAMAPRVTLARSVGLFAAVWLTTSGVAVGAGVLAVRGAARLALRPLDRARRDVARVVTFGQGQRVPVDAPVEVAPLLQAVNELLDRLEAAHTLQVRFTADAAHELRTPVAGLVGQLEVALRRERTAADWRETLVAVHHDAERLRRLVEALTALARVDAGEAESHREPIRAAELAASALEAERSELEAAGCRATLHVDDDPELEVHPVLVELALANLLRNAARHAAGADVVLTVRADAERCTFEVRDTGPGIGPADDDDLFGRFVRRGDRRGLGLGLALAREVARRHGGDCTLRSVSTGGTRAVLVLPWRPLRA